MSCRFILPLPLEGRKKPLAHEKGLSKRWRALIDSIAEYTRMNWEHLHLV